MIQIGMAGVLVVAAYIGAQMLADIASLKIGVIGGMAYDLGTGIFPLTFVLRDMAHKTIGKKNVQGLILVAGVINLVMVVYLLICAKIPGDPGWGKHAEFAAIFAPVWRITIASICAEVLAELTDTEIYHWFVTKITTRYQWARVLISNAVSVPMDSMIFTAIAFYGLMPFSVLVEICLTMTMVKYVVTVVSMPMIYLTPDSHVRG